MRYPIAIEIGNGSSAYGIVVPDLPGCFSAGDSMDEAIANAEEAALLFLEDYIDSGKAPPEASSLETIHGEPDFAGWSFGVVDVDLSKLSNKSTRINISVPDRLLAAIDAYAGKRGETRSGFLTRAALAAMDAGAPMAATKRRASRRTATPNQDTAKTKTRQTAGRKKNPARHGTVAPARKRRT